jgi:hypothetical protein
MKLINITNIVSKEGIIFCIDMIIDLICIISFFNNTNIPPCELISKYKAIL